MLSIVIPLRAGNSPETTLRSLAAQIEAFPVTAEVIISHDSEKRGASWARNQGARLASGDLLLFSDDDIRWQPDALAKLHQTLKDNPGAAYSYGHYEMASKIQCNVPFSAARLRMANFISTMSLIRADRFPGFDEKIERLQDWDLWLTMLKNFSTGVYCGSLIFTTAIRPGITYGGGTDYKASRRAVMTKHNLKD